MLRCAVAWRAIWALPACLPACSTSAARLHLPAPPFLQGQGLGNSFLSHISAVDGIFHVCRAFDDADVVHVEDRVDPVEGETCGVGASGGWAPWRVSPKRNKNCRAGARVGHVDPAGALRGRGQRRVGPVGPVVAGPEGAPQGWATGWLRVCSRCGCWLWGGGGRSRVDPGGGT